MSYQGSWKALNLEFSDRVPRTEYSAQSYHWPLVQTVTGIDTSIEVNREKATKEFVKRWDYAFMFMTPSGYEDIQNSGRRFTKMGHAEFAAGGEDFDAKVYCPFKTLEEVYTLQFFQSLSFLLSSFQPLQLSFFGFPLILYISSR